MVGSTSSPPRAQGRGQGAPASVTRMPVDGKASIPTRTLSPNTGDSLRLSANDTRVVAVGANGAHDQMLIGPVSPSAAPRGEKLFARWAGVKLRRTSSDSAGRRPRCCRSVALRGGCAAPRRRPPAGRRRSGAAEILAARTIGTTANRLEIRYRVSQLRWQDGGLAPRPPLETGQASTIRWPWCHARGRTRLVRRRRTESGVGSWIPGAARAAAARLCWIVRCRGLGLLVSAHQASALGDRLDLECTWSLRDASDVVRTVLAVIPSSEPAEWCCDPRPAAAAGPGRSVAPPSAGWWVARNNVTISGDTRPPSWASRIA
jgi:hypothetical protein